MNFALVGQNNFDDLPLETQIKVMEWEAYLAPNPNYVEKGWTGGEIFWAIIIIAIVISAFIAKKK